MFVAECSLSEKEECKVIMEIVEHYNLLELDLQWKKLEGFPFPYCCLPTISVNYLNPSLDGISDRWLSLARSGLRSQSLSEGLNIPAQTYKSTLRSCKIPIPPLISIWGWKHFVGKWGGVNFSFSCLSYAQLNSCYVSPGMKLEDRKKIKVFITKVLSSDPSGTFWLRQMSKADSTLGLLDFLETHCWLHPHFQPPLPSSALCLAGCLCLLLQALAARGSMLLHTSLVISLGEISFR